MKTISIIAAMLFLSSLLIWGAVGGSISGTITDLAGAPISGVQITVTSAAQGIKTRAASNTKGAYRLPNLPVGRYDLKAELAGFKEENRRGQVVHVDDVIRIDLTLSASEKAEHVAAEGRAVIATAK